MMLPIFLIACTAVFVGLIIHQNLQEAKQLHHDRIDLLSNHHISIDQVLQEIMDKDI